MIKILKILIFSFWLNLITQLPAFAYLDPGSTSMILQSILAAIAGIGATYRLWIFKVKNFFLKIKKKIK
jgi:hypothetical protein